MRILLVDDHALFRDGIASLLRASGMEVVGEASDGLEAVQKASSLQPDLILMDINMPRCDGLEATRRIKAQMPNVRIVMLTVSNDSDDLFEAIKSGAQGYLLKDMRAEQFEEMLRQASQGEVALSPALATRMWRELSGERAQGPSIKEESLTQREAEVLELAARGCTNKEIGDTLYISGNTVNYHMKNILAKLQLRNRAQLVAYAFEHRNVKHRPEKQ